MTPLRTRIVGLLGLLVLLLTPALAQAGQEVILRVGESKTMYLGKIKSVDVGNPAVIEVSEHPDGDKIIIFGIKEGYSSLQVGTIGYDVNVVGNIERLRKDIETLLLDIPGVDVLTSGDRVVMDGVVKRRDDFERIMDIAESNSKSVYSLVLLDERDIVRKAQIQLHFQVLEVNRTKSHDIGIDWAAAAGPVQLVLDTMDWVQFGPGVIRDGAGTALTTPGGQTRQPDTYLNLQSQTDIRRVLDKNFFTTISGEEVTFFRGKELVFVSQGVGLSGNTSNFLTREVGLKVKAMPIIDDDGDIDLQIEIEFSTVGEAEFGGSIPAINTQAHTAHVQLREGESFALSGFFQRTKGRNVVGFPGLKDIPGLGLLFGSRAWQKGETDGIIVLTPVLLDPDRRAMRKQIKETLDIYDAADVKW